MKKLMILFFMLTPLMGCSASIDVPRSTSSTAHTVTAPAVSTTTYASPVSRTTVTRTNY